MLPEQKKNMTLMSAPLRVPAIPELSGPRPHGVVALAPGVRLALGRVHEVLGESGDIFALSAAARRAGPVVWIGLPGSVASLAPTGLQTLIDPARLILTTTLNRAESLWAAEQALRARCAPSVILELQNGPDLKESRRLQISAEESGAIGFVRVLGRAQTSAAETRWQCETSQADGWEWICTKNKRGPVGQWRANWSGDDSAPRLVALVSKATA